MYVDIIVWSSDFHLNYYHSFINHQLWLDDLLGGSFYTNKLALINAPF